LVFGALAGWLLCFTAAGGPGLERLLFVDMGIVERISLRHFWGNYRGAEGAPGSLLEPGSWG
jgi:hypothetical protein